MAQKGGYISKKRGAKKGAKKKAVDLFSKKEWFDLKAPSVFTKRMVGKTLVTRQSQKQNVEKLLLGRCFEVNQADLNPGAEENNLRKFKFIVQDVHGKEAISSFYEMNLTTDKARGVIKKWHTLIEGDIAVKTIDGYTLRVFVMGQSRRSERYTKARCYIQTTKIKEIRKKMFEIINNEVSDCNIDEVLRKICSDKFGKEIEKQCSIIYPLQNCFTKKVMVIKRPKYVAEDYNADVFYDAQEEKENISEDNTRWNEDMNNDQGWDEEEDNDQGWNETNNESN